MTRAGVRTWKNPLREQDCARAARHCCAGKAQPAPWTHLKLALARDRALLDDGRPCASSSPTTRSVAAYRSGCWRASWLLTYFQAEGNEAARLEHRQWLEREHPEAFVSGKALDRVLAERRSAGKWTYNGMTRREM